MIHWAKPGLIPSERPIYPWIIHANLTLLTLVTAIAVVAPNIAGPIIRGSLMLSFDQMRWIGLGYIMMLGFSVPVGVWLAERYGYKRILFLGAVIFVAGGVLGAYSWDFYSCLLGRNLWGIGAGIVLPLCNSILVKVIPKKSLSAALAVYIGIGFGTGSGLGYFLGGYFAQYLSWEALFLFLSAITLPSFLLIWLFHEETDPNPSARFDFLGYFFFVLFIGCLFVVINSGKAEWNTGGWTSPFILATSVLGFLGLIALIPWELKHPQPLIHFSLLKIHSFMLGSFALAFAAIVIYVVMTIGPIVTVEYLNYDYIMGGLILTPLGVSIGGMSVIAALLTHRIGVRWMTLAGMAILGLTCYLNSNLTIYSSHGQFLWIYNLRAVGMGLALGPSTALAMSEIPKAISGPASILLILFRQVGGTIGTASAEAISIQRTVFHNEMFGTNLNPVSPRFQQVMNRLSEHMVRDTGAAPEQAREMALGLIRKNVVTQSHYTAVNDAFYIIGMIIFVITALLFLEMMKRKFYDTRANKAS